MTPKKIRCIIVVDVLLTEDEQFFLDNAPHYVASKLHNPTDLMSEPPFSFLANSDFPTVYPSIDSMLADLTEGKLTKEPQP